MKDKQPFRIGVAGAGSWSAIAHIPAVIESPFAVLAGIADPDPARLKATGDLFGVALRCSTHRELIQLGQLDALIIATPHTTHYPLARDALDAGLHVLVEKPFTVRSSDARELISRATQQDLNIVVGYTTQFTPAAILAHEMVGAGELGELSLLSTLFTSNLDDFVRGKPGTDTELTELSPVGGPSASTYADPRLSAGGQGQSQVSHALGMQLWVSGLRPHRVSAFMQNHGAAVDLVDAMSYQLDNGALGSVAASGALGPRQEVRQEVNYYGSLGSLHHNFLNGQLDFIPRDGGPARTVCQPMSQDEGLKLAAAPVNCLVDLMRGAGVNRGPAEAATAAVELLEAAYDSANQNGLPIQIQREPH
jgi:predicted dehydrogenase